MLANLGFLLQCWRALFWNILPLKGTQNYSKLESVNTTLKSWSTFAVMKRVIEYVVSLVHSKAYKIRHKRNITSQIQPYYRNCWNNLAHIFVSGWKIVNSWKMFRKDLILSYSHSHKKVKKQIIWYLPTWERFLIDSSLI